MSVMDGFRFGVGFVSATGLMVVTLFMLMVAIDPILRGRE